MKKHGLELMLNYLLLGVVAVVVVLFLLVRRLRPYSETSFDPTEAQETWGGPNGHFPDTLVVDVPQNDFKNTSPGVR
jgi:hypothetical protein